MKRPTSADYDARPDDKLGTRKVMKRKNPTKDLLKLNLLDNEKLKRVNTVLSLVIVKIPILFVVID